MGVTTTNNKPLNPRGNDQSPLAFNRAKLYSGKALDFDGVNDDVLSTITISGAKTYCAWINADGTDNERFISISAGGFSNITFSNNKFGMYDGTNIPETTTTFETDQWYFVVAVQEANNAKIYINGISQPLSTTNWIEHTYTGATIAIGRDASSGAYYDGEISGVRVFNTALTAAQVADLYNNPEKVVPTGVDNNALKLWLPMQEGAGTTAYDGSGNGNHGAVSGATYTHGIGAPVSQTAVIDWNKGSNLLQNSEGFNSWITYTGASVNTNTTIAPDGQTTADTLNFASGNESLIYQNYGSGSATFTLSVWAKSSTNKKFTFRNWNGAAAIRSNEFTTSTEWQRFEYTFTHPLANIGISNEDNGSAGSIEIWGASLEQSSSVGPYVRTGATAQTSDVLLPQGLTTGRDITGVNLFENVRKQGALNLDGKSWAEVHDNESLDMTDGISLECWVYWNGGISDKGILGRYVSATPGPLLYVNSATSLLFFAATSANLNYTSMTTGWRHIVGTYNKVNSKLYIDGALVNTGSQTDDINLSANPFAIGRYNNEISKCYPNDIAQPRIYNRALTAEEVQRNYNAGKNTYTN